MLNKARNNHQEVLLEMQGEISVLEAPLNRLLDGSLSHYQSHLFVQSQHWKHENNASKLLKANCKSNRTMSEQFYENS